jgi:hypothetical protein
VEDGFSLILERRIKMCGYVRWEEGKLPICKPLNRICTMCIFGNMKQFKEAKKVQKEQEAEK